MGLIREREEVDKMKKFRAKRGNKRKRRKKEKEEKRAYIGDQEQDPDSHFSILIGSEEKNPETPNGVKWSKLRYFFSS